jgi:hypothetical protein
MKNNIKTLSYFLKRLRDSGFVAIKLFNSYNDHDPRRWTIMVDPEGACVMITCYENKEFRGDVYFEMNDGGNRFVKNYNLKTKSMEVVITNLLERNVQQIKEDCEYIKKY